MSKPSRFAFITFATLVAVMVTLLLGRWQLGRAHEREAQQAAIEAQGAKSKMGNKAVAEAGAADALGLLHRSAALRGSWLAVHTVYLDNRQMQGKPGFYVLTPLQLEGSAASILVQRGWVARNFSQRDALPQVLTPAGVVEVRGRLAGQPPRLLELGGVAENAGITKGPQSGLIRQNLNLQSYAKETGLRLLPVSLTQTGTASEGLLRDWPQVASGAGKNYGYAFQWFALSALMAGLYIWFQFGKSHVAKRKS